MKKILYIGIFSGTNIGDLVISNQLYRFIINKYDSSIDCMDFLTLKRIDYINTDIMINTNYNQKQITNILYIDRIIQNVYSKYFELASSNANYKFYAEYKAIVEKYDIIWIGGGNLIMGILNNHWAIRLNILVKMAKKTNKKIIISSVGVGPILLNKSKKLFKETLEIVDHITVRDEYSKYILKTELKINKKVDVSGDPALLLNDESTMNDLKNRKTINISISVMPFGKKDFSNLPYYKSYKYYIDLYKNLIEYFYVKNNSYIFYLFSTEWSDYDAIIELREYIIKNSKYISESNLKIEYIKSLTNLLDFYRRQDLLIGTRMHSLIIGFTQSLPIIAISWQRKVEGFMKYINLMQYCYHLNEVNENIEKIYNDTQKLLINNSQNNKIKLIELRRRYEKLNSFFDENTHVKPKKECFMEN